MAESVGGVVGRGVEGVTKSVSDNMMMHLYSVTMVTYPHISFVQTDRSSP